MILLGCALHGLAVAADALVNLLDPSSAARQSILDRRAGRMGTGAELDLGPYEYCERFAQASSPRPPGGGDGPAGSPPPLTPPVHLSTSGLLEEAAYILDAIVPWLPAADSRCESLIPELRDRAAQFRGRGD